MATPAEHRSLKAEALSIKPMDDGTWTIYETSRRGAWDDTPLTFRNPVRKVLLMTNPVVLNQYGTVSVLCGFGNVFEITQMVNDVSIQEVEAPSVPPVVAR